MNIEAADIRKRNFERYTDRQSLARLLVRYELFKMQMNIKEVL